MKNYPINKNKEYAIVTSDVLIANNTTYVSELNGQLDSDNLPNLSLDATKFVDAVCTNQDTSTTKGHKWEGATQAYHQVSRTSMVYGAGGDIFEPVATFDLTTDDWNKGWNRLVDITDCDNVFLEFDGKEGMLNGCANINFHHGFNVIHYDGTTATTGESWWTRWGVFVNGILVADSGKCYPRGENLVLPFGIPIGTQEIRIELKWMSITTRALNAAFAGYSGDPTTPLDIYGASIWARNTWR